MAVSDTQEGQDVENAWDALVSTLVNDIPNLVGQFNTIAGESF